MRRRGNRRCIRLANEGVCLVKTGRARAAENKRIPCLRKARVVTAGVSLAMIIAGSVGGPAVGAQDGPPAEPSAIAPYNPAEFFNGEAQASATTFKFNVLQGNANIGMSYGLVMSNYRDTTGSAEARALDLGIFPTLFGVKQCDGSAPILNPATFPPLTLATSTDPNATTPKPAEAHIPGFGSNKAGPLVGTQVATAAKGPVSAASTDSQTADMGLVSLRGGHSEVVTTLKDNVREARAVVTAKELKVMGSLFVFREPRWEAVARSGREVSTTGGFTFKSATVLGITRTPAEALRDLLEFKKGLEDALRPLGAKLELPSVVVDDNRVRVTPMSFKLVDPPFGSQMIAPFFANIQPLREAYNKAQLDKDCKNETNLMMMDVVLGVVSGSGSIEIMAGGVEAWTDDTDFSVPAITPVQPPSVKPAVPAVPATEGTPPSNYEEYIPGEYIPGDPGYSDSGDYTSTTSDVVPEAGGGAPPPQVKSKTKTKGNGREIAALPASTKLDDSKAGTAAVGVGLVGLLGAIGLAFGEHLKARRTTRRIP